MSPGSIPRFALFLSVLALAQAAALADSTIQTNLDVSGIGQMGDGASFAIVRGFGVVREGDVLPISTSEGSWKLRIVSIRKEGLEVEKFDVVMKAKEPPKPPEPAKTDKADKPRPKVECRDPFWPVGFDPAAG